jgi:hypothetical protein
MRFPQTTDMAELVFGEALRCDRTSAGLHGVIVLFIVLLLVARSSRAMTGGRGMLRFNERG